MLEYGKDVVIEEGAIIDVKDGFIGDRTIIRAGVRIEGTKVVLGTESYLDYGSWIGGGSCFDSQAYLVAGDFLHMGWNSQINTARGVSIGHEFGFGVESKIFTHGAYLPIDRGFPVQWGMVTIGDYVWLPNAWVNPGVSIESNVVVAARSVINRNIPFGSLAGGVPCKVIKENAYPKALELDEITDILIEILSGLGFALVIKEGRVWCGPTIFDISKRIIYGPVSKESETVKNQLRRNGIRFRYTAKDGRYKPW